MDICKLIISYLPRLAEFSYSLYPPAFADFEREAEPFFFSLEEKECGNQAAAVIDGLEELRAALGRREQKDRAYREKQVLALFLAPAALRRGGAAAEFAETLSRMWNGRYPRNVFYPGSYETIMKGFDANLLGLPLRKTK